MKQLGFKVANLSAAALLVFAVGCAGAEVGDSETGVATAKSELGWWTGQVIYDSTTKCYALDGGPQMSCCPAGYAMLGYYANYNILKCGLMGTVAGGMRGDRYLSNLVRPIANVNMLACPYGKIMVGYHKNNGLLICESPRDSVDHEFVDATTLDRTPMFPMHVCPEGGQYFTSAMSGIQLNKNWFGCAW